MTSARFLVVLDVDSTLIENEAIELLADAAGSLDLVADVTERAMRGEIDFAESLRLRVGTLKGLPVEAVEAARERIRVTPGVPELVESVHRAGGAVAVVSGGFHELLDPLAESLGLDVWRANRLCVEDGTLTGEVDGGVIDAEAKALALAEWAVQFDVPVTRTIAVGDGANDLRMMETAALSVAFCAKPVVRRQADVALATRDLSQLLPVLGLRG
ncbi:phosphoserine phosphatase SerB [Desertivibrio insolitus]|uniref:phosphoserine phosphatase SerB n=1 Tax=Herbiconiux sp. SYSU D00978 TaxID=2812562 RepID=UPI001A9756AD|nr:phosphoserine phosphatase SerB [Herbiconiux sp. SYSU D00978]